MQESSRTSIWPVFTRPRMMLRVQRSCSPFWRIAVCMDPECTEISVDRQSGICGRMYSQPRERCDCGSRVLELYTCRYCGTAYARSYTDDVDNPTALWSEPGRRLRMAGGDTSPLL